MLVRVPLPSVDVCEMADGEEGRLSGGTMSVSGEGRRCLFACTASNCGAATPL